MDNSKHPGLVMQTPHYRFIMLRGEVGIIENVNTLEQVCFKPGQSANIVRKDFADVLDEFSDAPAMRDHVFNVICSQYV